MRTLMTLAVGAGIVAGMTAIPLSVEAQPHCRRECFPIPGGVRCRVCCPRPVPRYVPPRQTYVPPAPVPYNEPYTPNYEYTPQYTQSHQADVDGLIILLGIGLIVVVGIVAAMHSSSTSDELAGIEKETADIRAQTHQDVADKHAIDNFIEATARAHFERGRADAYKEWTGS